MKRIFAKLAAALCALMLTVLPAGAQEQEDVTLPSGRTLSRIQTEMADYAQENKGSSFASAEVGIFRGDQVLFTGYYGCTDLENDIPCDENSVYEWGSISKTLIWVSAMQLWEQGQLDLDRDIREYLPQGFFRHLTYDDPITFQNLMDHNAGWQETTRPVWTTEEVGTDGLKEALQAIEPAQVHRPGEVVAYSNYGAAVAGYIIECITGQSYCDYVHEHIFEPLGMEHTALAPAHNDNQFVYDQRAKMHSYTCVYAAAVDKGPALEYVEAYPAGAATGTLSDLMTYAQALVNKDAPLFRNKETREVLFTPTHFYADSHIPTSAHGFFAAEQSVRTWGHSGSTLFGQANMVFDPETGTGVVVMVNDQNGNWYLSAVPDLVFGELSADKYPASGTEEISGYYLSARSTPKGMLNIIQLLTASQLKEETEVLGGGLQQIRYPTEEGTEAAVLVAKGTWPDGRDSIEQPSVEAVRDPLYLLKLSFLVLYVLAAYGSIYLLRVRRAYRKHKKPIRYRGSGLVLAGTAGRLVSLLALLVMSVIYIQCSGGLSYTAAAAIGITQMACAAVCTLSALGTLALIPQRTDTSAPAYRYLMSAAVNAVTVGAIICFQMYWFWAI